MPSFCDPSGLGALVAKSKPGDQEQGHKDTKALR